MRTSTIKIIMSTPVKRQCFDSTIRCKHCGVPMWNKGEWYLCPTGCSDGQWLHQDDLKAYYK